ncbi:MAG: methyltransferase domain-containing protein [Candidatus Dadabacteria bacterium]|nr:methyltransferase domain-containing protein [Candidatus Dadabacteria bacterium]
MSWNPELYHKFQKERFEPFKDLLDLIVIRERLRVLDLGCGTGELTEMVLDMLPESQILGIDNSPEMLNKAIQRKGAGLDFELSSIEDVSGNWDLIFSNAAIQWVDNHLELVPRLVSLLNPGGQIAVQLPANHSHSTQTMITKIADEEPFKTALNSWQREWSVLSIRDYAELLYESGACDINVFEKIYPHVLENIEAVIDWLSGTALLPYFERLPQELHEDFLNSYRERLQDLYPAVPVFYPFQRIFFSARMPQ